jgi:hypothetical protein
MDDARIQSLKQEVLAQLREGAAAEVDRSGLEARVAALEAVVGQLVGRGAGPGSAPSTPTLGHATTHPSFQVFTLAGPASDRCVMEPDKPCVKSHACRTFGY